MHVVAITIEKQVNTIAIQERSVEAVVHHKRDIIYKLLKSN